MAENESNTQKNDDFSSDNLGVFSEKAAAAAANAPTSSPPSGETRGRESRRTTWR